MKSAIERARVGQTETILHDAEELACNLEGGKKLGKWAAPEK